MIVETVRVSLGWWLVMPPKGHMKVKAPVRKTASLSKRVLCQAGVKDQSYIREILSSLTGSHFHLTKHIHSCCLATELFKIPNVESTSSDVEADKAAQEMSLQR